MFHRSINVFKSAALGCSLFVVLGFVACGGGPASSNVTPPPPPPPTPSNKNAALFGQHIQSLATTWPSISFGDVRVWSNIDGARWGQISTADGVYDFTVLDSFLAEFHAHGITDVLYTIGQVPNWASSDPADNGCDFATARPNFGGCDLPTDINSDGTGTDQTFINFVKAIAQHVNDPTYLQTHAHIRYWEPWNEIYRNNKINSYPYSAYSVRATYAQLVRMAEDVRCTILGKGSVNGSSCTSTPIDSTALILSDSANIEFGAGGPVASGALPAFQNFLYCNGTGESAPISGSGCTTGSAGSAAIDIINSHFYEGGGDSNPPENLAAHVAQYSAVLSSTDMAKPFWSDEGGWNSDTNVPDPDVQASWIARYYLVGWGTKLSRIYWYAYDSPLYGTLWTPGGGLDPAGQAFGSVYKWVVSSTLTAPCSNSGTVWTCSLTLGNGSSAEAIWDTSQTCSNGNCTSAAQNLSSQWANFQDLSGTNHAVTTLGSVPVGIKPILLTTSSSSAP